MTEKTIHEGRNVKRIREILGIKQDTLAAELGLSQQAISQLEQKEKIDGKILEDVAKVLKVPAEAIRNFNEDATLNIISNTFTSNDTSTLHAVNYYPVFNAVEKIVELYERMLKEKDEMIKKLMKKKK